jgi:hypothetical protein
MKPVPEGSRIRVVRNSNHHNYTIGQIYTVNHDDQDGTFDAADAGGKVGDWLRWEDCEPASPSAWDQIAADLPEDLVRFLSCFDGIQSLTLRQPIVDAMLAKLPDLHERIVAAAARPEVGGMISANRPNGDELPTAIHPETAD